MMKPLESIRACVFDAYGTLFDLASATARFQDRIGEPFARFSALWRDKQLQYTWLRSLQGRHLDFWQVTGDALDYAMDACGIDDQSLRADLLNQYLKLEVFPEVPSVLRQLKEAGFKTAILSNGSRDMLEQVVVSAGIDRWLDMVLSVDSVGIFKPHASVYQLAVDQLALPASEMSFQSSNSWDAYAASAFGMQVVWCNRYGQLAERLPGEPDRLIKTLSELPALLNC